MEQVCQGSLGSLHDNTVSDDHLFLLVYFNDFLLYLANVLVAWMRLNEVSLVHNAVINVIGLTCFRKQWTLDNNFVQVSLDYPEDYGFSTSC